MVYALICTIKKQINKLAYINIEHKISLILSIVFNDLYMYMWNIK